MEKIKELAEHLQKYHLGVVATVSKDHEPQAATVDFLTIVEGEKLILYFLTRRHTRKYENLLQNPRVGFVVGFGPEANTVQMQGKAHRLTEEAEIDIFFTCLESRPELKDVYFGKDATEPWSEAIGVNFEAVRIEIEWARWVHRTEEGKLTGEMIIE